MEVKEIIEKEIWEDFLSRCQNKTFLISWNWGEFQKKMGEEIWRLGIYDKDNLLAVALATSVSAKRGRFLFVPHGPVIKNTGDYSLKFKILNILTDRLKDLASRQKMSFIRIAPIWDRTEENESLFKSLGFRDAPTHMHAELTWELDLTPDEEQLLSNMRKTTRYLIRQAMKNKDIEVIQGKDLEDVDEFYKLHLETVERHRFTPFSLDYIKKEFESFSPDNQITVFHGKYKGELLASAIIVFWGGIAFYHHGASSMKYPKIPVAYLLQWRVIQEAKQRGLKKYNFWGIAPISETKESSPHKEKIQFSKNHPWYGLTLFKIGFGGYKKEYVKTKDMPLSLKYWPIAIFELLRRKKRGL